MLRRGVRLVDRVQTFSAQRFLVGQRRLLTGPAFDARINILVIKGTPFFRV
jgi:hypothetical protein